MNKFYRFTIDSENEGSRSFVYEAEDDREADKVASQNRSRVWRRMATP